MRRDALGELRRFVHRQQISPEDGILVAISGGRDSVVLGHSFYRLVKERPGWRWRVVTINHGLRPEAEKETAFVSELCREWGVLCETVRLTPPSSFDAGSLAWAREARLSIYRELRERCRLTFVATAHHQGDQAETVLMRLIRGAAPATLASMRERDGPALRPFLQLAPDALDHYLQRHQLKAVDDPSNHDRQHLRTRVREILLPCLTNVAGFDVLAHLGQLAEDAASDERYFGERVGERLGFALANRLLGEDYCALAWLRREPKSLRRRLLWRLLQHQLDASGSGDPRLLNRAHLDAVLRLLVSRGEVLLPEGIAVRRQGDWLCFAKKAVPEGC